MSRDYDDDYDDDRTDRGDRGGGDDFEGDAATDAAMARTNLPGIFLIIVGVINLLAAFGTGGIAFKTATTSREEFEQQQKEVAKIMPGLAEQAKAVPYEEQQRQGTIAYGLWTAALLLSAILPLIAGVRMRSLHNYALCLVGAIVAVLPGISAASCPCLFGAAIGIWAIVALANQEVKRAFR